MTVSVYVKSAAVTENYAETAISTKKGCSCHTELA